MTGFASASAGADGEAAALGSAVGVGGSPVGDWTAVLGGGACVGVCGARRTTIFGLTSGAGGGFSGSGLTSGGGGGGSCTSISTREAA